MSNEREDFLNAVVETYSFQRDRYEKMAREVARISEELLRQHGIRGNVQWRAKDPSRLLAKIQKSRYDEFRTERAMLARIGDLAAARITTYVETDREKVVARLKDRFEVTDGPQRKEDDPTTKSKFYRATHVQARLLPQDAEALRNVADLTCEIQVCSMLAHVYNEIEHDLGYKPFSGDLSKAEIEALDAIGNIVKAGDTLIVHAIQRVEERNQNENGRFNDQHDFISRMRPLFGKASSFADNAGQLYDLFLTLGISSPNDVRARFLGDGDYQDRATERLASLQDWLMSKYQAEGAAIRYLPENKSSDLLMALAVDSKDIGMREWLATAPQGRPNRLRTLAGALKEMIDNVG